MTDKATPKPLATKKYVRWHNANTFEERVIRYRDWVLLGAEELAEGAPVPADTVWTEANNWTVPRAAVPLTDEQLLEFCGLERKFTVVEK